MKNRFRTHQRGIRGRFYFEDNEAALQPALNARIGRAHLITSDPKMSR
jgi:hypothetical protein